MDTTGCWWARRQGCWSLHCRRRTCKALCSWAPKTSAALVGNGPESRTQRSKLGLPRDSAIHGQGNAFTWLSSRSDCAQQAPAWTYSNNTLALWQALPWRFKELHGTSTSMQAGCGKHFAIRPLAQDRISAGYILLRNLVRPDSRHLLRISRFLRAASLLWRLRHPWQPSVPHKSCSLSRKLC